jgi:hypothetical protein
MSRTATFAVSVFSAVVAGITKGHWDWTIIFILGSGFSLAVHRFVGGIYASR